ncbi:unnamed protein product, partial [Schistosoma mattheei]
RKIEQILFASVKQNRFDLVSRIIDGHKCDINVRDSFDRTPLHLAASSGNLPMVKLLIEGRALVDPVDKVSHYSFLFIVIVVFTMLSDDKNRCWRWFEES